MPPERLDFSPIDDVAIRQLLIEHAPRLQLAFRTDFVRSTWEINHGPSSIELALDLGYIRTTHHREAIHEVELELLSGKEEDLEVLSQHLLRTLPLTPLDPSKAARGFALLDRRPSPGL